MWKSLPCNARELQLLGTLNGGQSFRWKQNLDTGEWTGVFSGTVWKLLQNENEIKYRVVKSINKIPLQRGKNGMKNLKKVQSLTEKTSEIFFEELLKDYLRIDIELCHLYDKWSECDPIFKKASERFYGIRILNQEPVENLFSFICSQNNHISRISSMIEKLCSTYGEKICIEDDVVYYSFPSVNSLADPEVENKLRDLGFGYRAKFIQQSAAMIMEWGNDKWFESLKAMEYDNAKAELIKLHGVGAKVADCICLMSLGHLEAVPVDTHVYQIASQQYLPHLKGLKSVTDRVYKEIGEHFRKLYGPYAGWAHTVLFCADLKKFEETGVKRISDNNLKTSKSNKKKCK